MGWVGAALTVAGGGDYGDETVDTLRGHVWDRNHEVTTFITYVPSKIHTRAQNFTFVDGLSR